MVKLAQIVINQPTNFGIPAQKADIVQTVLKNAITVGMTIGVILLLFYFLWGAIDWIMSGGDKEKVGNAQKKITSALVGFVLLALLFLIVRVIGQVVGFNPLQKMTFPNLGNP
ncbi:hypothetical protein HY025_02775 [Candidatus Daviesbacteria bacterium]|nr:hypothetical protein [Candidatus Daviesbacteria bacterium]